MCLRDVLTLYPLSFEGESIAGVRCEGVATWPFLASRDRTSDVRNCEFRVINKSIRLLGKLCLTVYSDFYFQRQC